MVYLKTKRYYLKNDESLMESHLKSLLTRTFQVLLISFALILAIETQIRERFQGNY